MSGTSGHMHMNGGRHGTSCMNDMNGTVASGQ